MRKKKSFFSILMVSAMLLSLAACGDKTTDDSSKTSASVKDNTSVSVSVSKEVETKKDEKPSLEDEMGSYLLSTSFGCAMLLDAKGKVRVQGFVGDEDAEAIAVFGDYLIYRKYFGEEDEASFSSKYVFYAKNLLTGEVNKFYEGEDGIIDYYDGKIYFYSYLYTFEKTITKAFEYGTFQEIDASEYYADSLGGYKLVSGALSDEGTYSKCIKRIVDETGYVITYLHGEYFTFDGEAFILLEDFTSGEEILDYNKDYILFTYYPPSAGRALIALYNHHTSDVTIMSDMLEEYLGSDGRYNYFSAVEDNDYQGIRLVYRVDMENGSYELVLTPNNNPGTDDYNPGEGIKTIGDYSYYLSDDAGKVFFSRVNQEGGEQVGDVVYTYPYALYGRIEAISEAKSCGTCGAEIATGYSEYFVPSESISKEASKIAAVLKENAQSEMEYIGSNLDSDSLEECNELLHGYYGFAESLMDQVTEVNILGQAYLAVTKYGYWYDGSASGISLNQCNLFELSSGKELGLKDVIGVSEEEFKEVVGKKAAELFDEYVELDCGNPFYYDTAQELAAAVAESVSVENACVAYSQDGIVLLYPCDYISAFSSGTFDFWIPYNELNIGMFN